MKSAFHHFGIWLFLVCSICGQLFADKEILVGNAGIPGDATTQGLARMENSVCVYRPTAVAMMFGTNDCAWPERKVDIPQYESNLLQMVQTFKAKGVRHVILITPPPAIEEVVMGRKPELVQHLPAGCTLNQRLRQYGEAVKRVASKTDCPVVDFYQLIQENGGGNMSDACLLRNPANSRMNDGIHPTKEGYQLLGQAVARIAGSLLKPGDVIIAFGDSITYGVNQDGAGTAQGDTYPAELWRMLNPDALKAGLPPAQPSRKDNPVNASIIPNGAMRPQKNGTLPASWYFWKKKQDVCQARSENGLDYLFLQGGGADSAAFARSEVVPVKGGATCHFSMKLRGQGSLDIQLHLYPSAAAKAVSLKKIELTSQWQLLEMDFKIPAQYQSLCLAFQTTGTANITEVSCVPQQETPPAAAILTPGQLLESNGCRMQFSRAEQGAVLLSLKNSGGTEFINYAHRRGLWSIRLKKRVAPSGLPPYKNLSFDPEQNYGTTGLSNDGESSEDLVIDAMDAVRLGASVKQEAAADGSLCLSWNNITVDDQKNALDVQVRICPEADGCIAFRASFQCRSPQWMVFFFLAPQFDGLGGLHRHPEQDFLATPYYLGRLIQNPASGRLLGTNRLFRGNYSGHSMHFDALYNSGEGLLFHVQDSRQMVKRWLMESDQDSGLAWAVCNIPDNMRGPVPQKWTVPYQTTLAFFKGDWFDAAKIYRSWALKQYWCEKGTLVNRRNTGDIAPWFLDRTFWMQFAINQFSDEYPGELETFISQWNKKFSMGAEVVFWGLDNSKYDFPTPDRFPLTPKDLNARSCLKQRGIPAMGYLQSTGWTRSCDSFRNTPEAADNLVRNVHGQALTWGRNGVAEQTCIAYPGETWTRLLGDKVVQMAKEGFDAAYMDSGNHGGFYLNFTPACSSCSGGGNGYVMGMQKMFRQIKKRAREIRPGFALTAESFWEGNLNCLDAVYTVNNPSAYMEGKRVAAIPMGQAVYHDYALCYGTHYSRMDSDDRALGHFAKTAQALSWGIMPGLELFGASMLYNNRSEVNAATERRFRLYGLARKYLEYGEMCRPPIVVSPATSQDVPWTVGWGPRQYHVTLPDIFATAWKAPDGQYGIFLFNLAETAQIAEIQLPEEFPEGVYTSVSAEKSTAECSRTRLMSINLPPRIPMLLEAPRSLR